MTTQLKKMTPELFLDLFSYAKNHQDCESSAFLTDLNRVTEKFLSALRSFYPNVVDNPYHPDRKAIIDGIEDYVITDIANCIKTYNAEGKDFTVTDFQAICDEYVSGAKNFVIEIHKKTGE